MKRRLTFSVRKGHHFQWKVYERSTFFVKSGIWKGEGLYLGTEPPRTPTPVLLKTSTSKRNDSRMLNLSILL